MANQPELDELDSKQARQILLKNSRSQFERSNEDFLKLIEIIKKYLRLSYKDQAEIFFETAAERTFFINRRNDLSSDRRKAVVSKIYGANLKSRAMLALTLDLPNPAPVLFATLNLMLDIADETVENAPKILSGNYQFWRYSNSMMGCFVKGLYIIQQNQETGELSVAVHQRFEQRPDGESGDTFEPHLDQKTENLTGIVTRMSGDRLLVQLWDSTRRIFRINVFNRLSYAAAKRAGRIVKDMSGLVAGFDDGTIFVSPVYVERIPDDRDINKIKASLNTYTPEMTPLRVRANLRLMVKRTVLTD